MKKLAILVMVSSCFIGTAVYAGEQSTEQSLYQRLGGYNAIVAVVNDLFPRLAGDEHLGRFWAHRGSDGIAREKQLLIDFIVNQAGGDLYYRGREMKLLHQGMHISENDWRILMKHTNTTLDKFKLAKKERQDVIAFLESTKADIVESP